MHKKVQKQNWLGTLLSFATPCRGKMVLSVFCAVISVAGGFVPYIGVYQIIRHFIEETMTLQTLLLWSAISIAGQVVKLLFYAFSTVLSHISAYTILEGIRLKIADRLLTAPLGVVMGKTIGHLKNTITDRVEGIEPPLAHLIPELFSNLMLPVGIFMWLLAIDWRMALAALVTVPIAMIPMVMATGNFNEKYNGYMQANDNVNSTIVEYIEGIEVVKAFGQTSTSYEKYAGTVKTFQAFTLEWFRSTWKTLNFVFSMLPTTLLGTLPVGLLLYLGGALSPSALCLCLILALGIVGPFIKFAAFVNEIKAMEFSVNGARELLEMEALPDSGTPVAFDGYGISLENVSFSYSGEADENVLHGVSLNLPQNSFTALVGPSGGGKSTVAKLIARFWDVQTGVVSIGGQRLKNIPLHQLAQTVSYVAQDNFLFNCSLMENIRLGNPAASDEAVFEAARAAQCYDFIAALEKGFATSAGEAGRRLSGGEKQRIAIARAILKDAPIVILDEATAFTDPENEDKIQRSIMALTKGKTLLVIAHRLSTITSADQIVVLEDGQVLDVGGHSELLGRCKLYERMWQAHIGAKNWAVSAGERAVKAHA